MNRFLKGPIPWPWLCLAAGLPGKALHVGIAIWHLSAMRRSRSVRVGNEVLEELGVNRWAKYRALAVLEREGLIEIERKDHRSPTVTLLDVPSADAQP